MGAAQSKDQAVAKALEMMADGATVIDVGGESTSGCVSRGS